MPSILKREFAPISDQAWDELDTEAARSLKRILVGRKVVDVSGPHGWELGAVNVGRLVVADNKTEAGVGWGLREVQPIVETRLGFKLQQLELDDISRGAEDADIDPMLEAVGLAGEFEDNLIFNGFDDGGVTGVLDASEMDAVALPADPDGYPTAVGEAVKAMSVAGIGGPYALVLGTDAYFALMQAAGKGFPPYKAVANILGSEDILMTGALEGGVVMSTRGGDFELTLGKDFSLGYAAHDRTTVELFVTESLTFRVLEPKAAVPIE